MTRLIIYQKMQSNKESSKKRMSGKISSIRSFTVNTDRNQVIETFINNRYSALLASGHNSIVNLLARANVDNLVEIQKESEKHHFTSRIRNSVVLRKPFFEKHESINQLCYELMSAKPLGQQIKYWRNFPNSSRSDADKSIKLLIAGMFDTVRFVTTFRPNPPTKWLFTRDELLEHYGNEMLYSLLLDGYYHQKESCKFSDYLRRTDDFHYDELVDIGNVIIDCMIATQVLTAGSSGHESYNNLLRPNLELFSHQPRIRTEAWGYPMLVKPLPWVKIADQVVGGGLLRNENNDVDVLAYNITDLRTCLPKFEIDAFNDIAEKEHSLDPKGIDNVIKSKTKIVIDAIGDIELAIADVNSLPESLQHQQYIDNHDINSILDTIIIGELFRNHKFYFRYELRAEGELQFVGWPFGSKAEKAILPILTSCTK